MEIIESAMLVLAYFPHPEHIDIFWPANGLSLQCICHAYLPNTASPVNTIESL